MRFRMLRGVAAAALGVALVLPIGQPVRADIWDYCRDATDPCGKWIDIGVELLRSLLTKSGDGALTPGEVSELVQETVNAVNGVRTDLLARLDSQVVNEIRGQSEAALAGLVYLTFPPLAGPWIISVHNAAHNASSHLDTVSADGDIDAVGRAMITLFNVHQVALEATNAHSAAVAQLPYYRRGLERLISKMNPRCSYGGVVRAGQLTYTCEFNGKTVRAEYWESSGTYSIDGGPPIAGLIDTGLVQRVVMGTTARALAEAALAELIQRGVPLPP